MERFVPARDGPNVCQAFDAVWTGRETETWRFYGLVSQPVQYRDDHPFDDQSSGDALFSGGPIEGQFLPTIEAPAYCALYQRKHAALLTASGEEDRHVLDIRTAGKSAGFDWDAEAMGQVGQVGSADILAWALGARTGYTFEELTWSPRIGMQFDVASGDRNASDGTLGSFNPLFANGFYFSLKNLPVLRYSPRCQEIEITFDTRLRPFQRIGS
ncbi:alginate export family protein [Rhizobium sp. P40RR-XXII]|uniref:alginate export family protein n=1 Tax=Rhizobium sp. P40RR-XXII TaxID=2726739 RepID=UPI001FEFFCC1